MACRNHGVCFFFAFFNRFLNSLEEKRKKVFFMINDQDAETKALDSDTMKALETAFSKTTQ